MKAIGRRFFFAKTDWNTLQLEAKTLLEQKQYDKAKKVIQHALILAPKKAKALRIAYKVYREAGDLEQACQLALQLVQSHKGRAENFAWASHGLVNTGQRKEAREWLDKGLRKFPEDQTLLNMKSELQMLEEEPITFALPRSICLQSEPPSDFADAHRLYPWQSESTETTIQKHLNEIDNDDPGKPFLLHCKNAIITRSYGVHSLAGHPYLGTVLSRQKFSKDGRKWAKYPLGYPFRITTPRTEDLKIIPLAFYVTNTLCDHFGHLLTEAVSSIYPLLRWKEIGIPLDDIPIIIPANQNNQQGLRFNKLLKSLGLTKSNFIVPGKNGQSLLVQDLLLAKPSIILGGCASKMHPRIVRQFLNDQLQQELISECKRHQSDKVFISRSKLTHDTREIPGISELESLLERTGWLIFHPQLHSMQHQIRTYENAQYICSAPGSALHLLYGLELKKLERLILIAYKSDKCHNLINYKAQFEAQSLPFTILDCFGHQDTNSGIGEYFTNQKSSELKLELRGDMSYHELASAINQLCQG